jgi:hypothetical protein
VLWAVETTQEILTGTTDAAGRREATSSVASSVAHLLSRTATIYLALANSPTSRCAFVTARIKLPRIFLIISYVQSLPPAFEEVIMCGGRVFKQPLKAYAEESSRASYGTEWRVPYRNDAWKQVLPADVVLQLCHLAHEIHVALLQKNVSNWLCIGSLLGALREQALIPWEWDCTSLACPFRYKHQPHSHYRLDLAAIALSRPVPRS